MKRILFYSFTLGFLLISFSSFSQQKKVKITCVAFYNVENLYDTIDQDGVDDYEFTPPAPNQYDTKVYKHKLENLSYVISQIGDEYKLGGPVLLGLSEIENKNVLIDLANTEKLKSLKYGIAHIDGPDRRGVDVALLYQKEHFVVTNIVSKRLTIDSMPDFKTRDQLVVSGILDGDPIHIIVNHWPSRRGGEARSAHLRAAAASLARHSADSIMNLYPNAKIIIMGDLNDDPVDQSLMKYLKTKTDSSKTNPGDLFNPMYKMYKKDGIGSLAYNDGWNLFDQTVISYGLLKPESGYKFYAAKVFNRPFLTQKEGRFSGYPWRTYVGNTFMGGYSDHFPVYVFLVK